MATPAPPPPWWDTAEVQRYNTGVNVSNLDQRLVYFLIVAGDVHRALFRRALLITSGNDGQHVAGSAHYKDKAVDVRSVDLTADEQAIFSLALGYFSRVYKVAVFDERFTASPHWHIQTADSVGW